MRLRTMVFVLGSAILTLGALLFASHHSMRRRDAAILSPASSAAQATARRRAEEAIAGLPLSFEPNRGQAERAVQFLARGNGYTLLLARDQAVMVLDDGQEKSPADAFLQKLAPKERARFERTKYFRLSPRFKSLRKTETVRIALRGAKPEAAGEALGRLRGRSNYFLGGDRNNWRIDIPTYARVEYKQVYPGIDLVYYGNRQRPEFDFVVAPGANPKRINLLINAPGPLLLAANGSIQLAAGHGIFELLRPRIYQTVGGKRRDIKGRFVLNAKNEIGIELGQYDPSRAITIDPTLSYSTYFGGNGTEGADGIAVDSSGDIYVAGTTTATNFTTVNGYPPPAPPNGNTMVFVSKFDPAGTTLLYSTYLGGSGDQTVGALAIDQNGNAYVAGSTTSTDFPVVNGFQSALADTLPDAFVARIDTTQSGSASLAYSTYLGGGGNANNPYGDGAFGIATDGSGDAYVVGQTTSDTSVAAFPTTPGAYQSALDSQNGNAFLTVVNTNATGSGSLLYSTYLGGDGAGLFGDYAMAVAVNSSGDAFLTGQTSSDSSGPFPTTLSAYQTSLHGTDGNIFVSEIDRSRSGTTGLIYSTYLGGSDSNPNDPGDEGDGIALDTGAYVYIAATTSSSDFPTTAGAYDTTNSSVGKAAVVKMDATQSGAASLVYSTFLGGTNGEAGNSVAVDSSGDAFVAGGTGSTDFPTTTGAAQTTLLSSNFDGYFSELNTGATGAASLLYSTFLGGSCAQGDSAYSVALDATGNSYVSGETCSSDFPVTTGAYQSSLQGTQNAFLVKFTAGGAPAFSLSPASGTNCPEGSNCSSSATVQAGQTATYYLQLGPLNGFSGAVALDCTDALIESTCSASPSSVTLSANQVSTFTVAVTTSRSIAGIPIWMGTFGNWRNRPLLILFLLSGLVLILLGSAIARRQIRRSTVPVILVVGVLLVLGGCAAGLATRSGKVTVSGTSRGGASSSTSLTLTVH